MVMRANVVRREGFPARRIAIFPKRRRTAAPTWRAAPKGFSAMIASSFIQALHTDHPAADRADKLGLYGFLIGDWEMDSVIYDDTGTKRAGPRGEIHAGFVLEGRAIQDVWI